MFTVDLLLSLLEFYLYFEFENISLDLKVFVCTAVVLNELQK